MSDLWHPNAIQVPAPADKWGTYRGDTPYRGVLHTTETDTYTPSTSSYYGHQSWPHATIGHNKQTGVPTIWQHIPINRAARALKNPAGGVETNAAHAVQSEIVWRASKSPQMPDDLLAVLRSWMRWCELSVHIKPQAPPFYGADAGFTLATPTARQRMTPAAWNAFNGWCGHQHVPENDHWDPGAIPIDRLLKNAPTGDDDMPLTPDEKQWITDTVFNITKGWTDQILKAVAQIPGSGKVPTADEVADELADRLKD